MLTGTENFTGTLHPTIVFLTIVSFILIILINVRHSIFLMIFLSIMIPLGQQFEVFTLNFTIFRLFILAGWIKIIFNKNLKLGKFQKTDKAIIYWVIVSFIIYMIQKNNVDAFINQLGFAYNAIGVYFLYRILIKRKEDTSNIINTLAIVSAFVSVFMLIEQLTGENILYVFGGVDRFTPVRMGRLRSQGPFAHSIYAGVFGATMFPLYFSMWRNKWGSAFYGIIGTLSACVIVVTSSSTTPLIAGVSGFAALLFWPFRIHMRKVLYGILFSAVVLQIIMISPIWAFIKQMDIIKGSAALHRFELIDNLINRFTEWFLIGSSSIAYWGKDMHDQANQYSYEAVTGGFFRLALFIMIIVFSFKIIGNKIKNINDPSYQKKLWALGSGLFANLVGFLGISYWDQMVFVWYLFLALITSTCLINGETKLTVDEMFHKSDLGDMRPSGQAL